MLFFLVSPILDAGLNVELAFVQIFLLILGGILDKESIPSTPAMTG